MSQAIERIEVQPGTMVIIDGESFVFESTYPSEFTRYTQWIKQFFSKETPTTPQGAGGNV